MNWDMLCLLSFLLPAVALGNEKQHLVSTSAINIDTDKVCTIRKVDDLVVSV
jgi:hypothetical protein